MGLDIDATGILGPLLATAVGFALAFLLLAFVLRQHRRQSASMAWLLAIVLIPVVAVPVYLVFAGRKLAVRARAKAALHHIDREPARVSPGIGAEVEAILRGYQLAAASEGNDTALIDNGEAAYEALVAHIDGAEHSIHIATFQLASDRVGKALVARLARRAREGVQVRLLVDALGSLSARVTLLPRLRRAGGHTGVFMPALPVHRRWRANLRNHRKLAVFDDRVALAGGMNIGRRYIGARPTRRRWVDSMMRIQGPAVADLSAIFADDWEFATGEHLEGAEPGALEAPGNHVMQVVPSGPDVPYDALYDTLVAATYKAQRRVWIVTPYFVPDDGLSRALALQARLGSDVRVVMPRRSDHRVADMARQRSVRELMEAGVRFFVHRERMIHAKHVLVDDALAISGSANLDMRSLYLNYELALFGYDARSVAALESWVDTLLTSCEPYHPPRSGPLRRVAEDLCWLAGPLL